MGSSLSVTKVISSPSVSLVMLILGEKSENPPFPHAQDLKDQFSLWKSLPLKVLPLRKLFLKAASAQSPAVLPWEQGHPPLEPSPAPWILPLNLFCEIFCL